MEASHKTHRPHIKVGKDEEEEDQKLIINGYVTISSTISLTMPSSTMEFNEIVDNDPATGNDIVDDADVK